MNPEPGGLTVDIGDRETIIAMTGGGRWTIPTGSAHLVETDLENAGHPAPEHLTNALGTVQDHLDDVLREAPIVATAPSIEFAGRHALELAYVEIGERTIPNDYTLDRADVDDVFRTLVAEPSIERVHNPGLDAEHVDTIIGTCCVVLGIIRRLDLKTATVTRRPDALRRGNVVA